jgi:Protein of unknown function (DUF1360)
MEQATGIKTNGTPGRERKPDDGAGEALPRDYAALNAVWVGLAAGLVAATRGRASKDPIRTSELIPLSAATFALSKAVARERIGTWVREPFTDDETHRRPEGGRLKRAIGELVTCTRCVGTWSALAIVGLRVANPDAGRTVSATLAASAANDWLQAGFRRLCNAADASERR